MSKRRAKQMVLFSVEAMQATRPKDPAFAEAMREAADIRRWTDGPRVAGWRIYRLAQALNDGR